MPTYIIFAVALDAPIDEKMIKMKLGLFFYIITRVFYNIYKDNLKISFGYKELGVF